jgi:hypothetical protein
VLIPITGLSSLTDANTNICFLNSPCNFISSISTGTYVSYQWGIDLITLASNESTASYTFTAIGNYTLDLYAFNSISSANYSLNIIVIEALSGLGFKSGNYLQSSSLLGQNASFTFLLQSGENYFCLINFGDGNQLNISDSQSNINNTFVNHYYNSGGTYSVFIKCTNPVNTINLTVLHQVIEPITGLTLLNDRGTLVCFLNSPCNLVANTLTGTYLSYKWKYDEDELMTNLSTKSYTFTSTGTHSVCLNVSNIFTYQQTSANFEVIDRIDGLSFKSGNSNKSASIVGEETNFLLMIIIGQNYECSIEFGDGSMLNVSDSQFVINNTYISRTYANQEAVCSVYIICVCPANSSEHS